MTDSFKFKHVTFDFPVPEHDLIDPIDIERQVMKAIKLPMELMAYQGAVTGRYYGGSPCMEALKVTQAVAAMDFAKIEHHFLIDTEQTRQLIKNAKKWMASVMNPHQAYADMHNDPLIKAVCDIYSDANLPRIRLSKVNPKFKKKPVHE